MRYLYAGLGVICVALAVVGIVLPLLPTVPFLILAAFLFANSSERMHNWIMEHNVFGPLIDDWRRSGAVRPRAKRLATVSIAAVFALSVLLNVPVYVLVIQAIVLGIVLIFIWSRPNG
jgi:uncharacterized protein